MGYDGVHYYDHEYVYVHDYVYAHDALVYVEEYVFAVGADVGVPVGNAVEGSLVTGLTVGLEGRYVGLRVGFDGARVTGTCDGCLVGEYVGAKEQDRP